MSIFLRRVNLALSIVCLSVDKVRNRIVRFSRTGDVDCLVPFVFPEANAIDRHKRKKRRVSSRVVNVQERSRRVGRTVDANKKSHMRARIRGEAETKYVHVSPNTVGIHAEILVDQVEYRLLPDSRNASPTMKRTSTYVATCVVAF